MKSLFLSLIILLCVNALSDSAPRKDESVNDFSLKIEQISRSGSVTIDIANSAKKTIRIWTDSNSWGAARWRVFRIRNGRLEIFYQNPDQDFTVNVPDFTEVAGGRHIEKKLDLNGGNWCGLGRCTLYNERRSTDEEITFESGDMIIAIYDVPFTSQALRLNVWYGVAAAILTVQ